MNKFIKDGYYHKHIDNFLAAECRLVKARFFCYSFVIGRRFTAILRISIAFIVVFALKNDTLDDTSTKRMRRTEARPLMLALRLLRPT